MSGGVVRVAAKQVSASAEIFYGMALGLVVRRMHPALLFFLPEWFLTLCTRLFPSAKLWLRAGRCGVARVACVVQGEG